MKEMFFSMLLKGGKCSRMFGNIRFQLAIIESGYYGRFNIGHQEACISQMSLCMFNIWRHECIYSRLCYAVFIILSVSLVLQRSALDMSLHTYLTNVISDGYMLKWLDWTCFGTFFLPHNFYLSLSKTTEKAAFLMNVTLQYFFHFL